MFNMIDNVEMLHTLAEQVIQKNNLDTNKRHLHCFMDGVFHLEGLMSDGLESKYVREAMEEITCTRRCAPATTELMELCNLLEKV